MIVTHEYFEFFFRWLGLCRFIKVEVKIKIEIEINKNKKVVKVNFKIRVNKM